jgi:molybdate transport system permease protein
MTSLWIPLSLSLKVAGWATLLACVLGIGLAYALSRWQSRWCDLLDSVLTLPMVLPPTVIGYYLLVLLGRRSSVGQWLSSMGIELVFTWQGAVIAATVVAFPMILKAARAAFEDVDLKPLAIFFRVSLPLAARGIMAGVLLAFARALGEFGATLMIAGSIPGRTQTMSIAIYEAVQAGEDQQALVLVAIISVTCVLVLWSTSALSPRHVRRKRGMQ